MTPLERRIALLRAQIRPIEIARGYRCSPSVVTKVLDGETISRPLQRYIARRLGLPVSELFPRASRTRRAA